MRKKIFLTIGAFLFLAAVFGSPSQNLSTSQNLESPTPENSVKGVQTTGFIPVLSPIPTIIPTATYTPSSTPQPVVTVEVTVIYYPTATPVPARIVYPTQVVSYPTAVPTTSSGLSGDNYYTNVEGNEVHSPAYSDTVPQGATARCGDGTYSFSQHRQGTCSHHGGVAQWL
ncbi:DUF3761 domain-containing protein [Patescibacteria group bacterium]|nr:DUF3761 domain-containing protein [Patescibacteria group bacterium]MCL5797443.1 DUF3761 domain-containing protein [Patescibacteria group bacterium]